jgi:hypothetical protein
MDNSKHLVRFLGVECTPSEKNNLEALVSEDSDLAKAIEEKKEVISYILRANTKETWIQIERELGCPRDCVLGLGT